MKPAQAGCCPFADGESNEITRKQAHAVVCLINNRRDARGTAVYTTTFGYKRR